MKYLYILLISAISLLTSCSGADAPEDGERGECVALSFNMFTSGVMTGTRADSEGHSETDSEFREFENGIDLKDFGILVFAKIAGTTAEEKLVYKLTNLLDSDDARVNVIVGSEGNYLINLMILRDELRDVLNHSITPEGDAIISFRMLILANCSPAMNANTMWDAVSGKTFTAVISQLAEWGFPMSDIYNADGGPGVASLYSNSKKHCPMFGTNVFATTEAALYYSRPEDRVYLGEVNLLRALAKVRVVDNIQTKDALGYPRIVAAEFISSQDQARQIPYNAKDYQDGQQVHSPNIFEENTNLTAKATYRLGTLPESWILPATQRKGNVFIGFVPEQKIGHHNNNYNDGMPQFHVTIENRKADGTTELLDYIVPMTRYYRVENTNENSDENLVEFHFGDNILRNHIYTLSVNDFGATLSLTVDVVPYRSCVLEPYFGLAPKP